MAVQRGNGVARWRICKSRQAWPTVMADRGEFRAQTRLRRVASDTPLLMATMARACHRTAGTAHVPPTSCPPHPGENDLLHRSLPRRTLSQIGLDRSSGSQLHRQVHSRNCTSALHRRRTNVVNARGVFKLDGATPQIFQPRWSAFIRRATPRFARR